MELQKQAYVTDLVKGTNSNGRVTKWTYVCTCKMNGDGMQQLISPTTKDRAKQAMLVHMHIHRTGKVEA